MMAASDAHPANRKIAGSPAAPAIRLQAAVESAHGGVEEGIVEPDRQAPAGLGDAAQGGQRHQGIDHGEAEAAERRLASATAGVGASQISPRPRLSRTSMAAAGAGPFALSANPAKRRRAPDMADAEGGDGIAAARPALRLEGEDDEGGDGGKAGGAESGSAAPGRQMQPVTALRDRDVLASIRTGRIRAAAAMPASAAQTARAVTRAEGAARRRPPRRPPGRRTSPARSRTWRVRPGPCAGQADDPGAAAGDDQLDAEAGQQASGDQGPERGMPVESGQGGQSVDQPGAGHGGEAGHDDAPAAAPIRQPTGPRPRHQRGGGLHAHRPSRRRQVRKPSVPWMRAGAPARRVPHGGEPEEDDHRDLWMPAVATPVRRRGAVVVRTQGHGVIPVRSWRSGGSAPRPPPSAQCD